MNRNKMFQLVFNLVWALPLDTGQKILGIFIKCKYRRLRGEKLNYKSVAKEI